LDCHGPAAASGGVLLTWERYVRADLDFRSSSVVNDPHHKQHHPGIHDEPLDDVEHVRHDHDAAPGSYDRRPGGAL
jgi:hypothetical protein